VVNIGSMHDDRLKQIKFHSIATLAKAVGNTYATIYIQDLIRPTAICSHFFLYITTCIVHLLVRISNSTLVASMLVHKHIQMKNTNDTLHLYVYITKDQMHFYYNRHAYMIIIESSLRECE